VPGGTYYLVQLVSRDQTLLHDEQDYIFLEASLRRSLIRTHTVALAFCWLPRALHLAVRSEDVSVSRFMQGWTSSLARHLHRRSHDIGHVFRQRFQSVLLDPQTWLPELTRFIHHLPVREGLIARAEQYAYSSCAPYSMEAKGPGWLHTRATLLILERRGLSAPRARTFLSSAPSAADLELFAVNGHSDARILGEPALHRDARPAITRRLTPTRIIELVAQLHSVTPAAITSSSRSRSLALARAMVAWQITERHLDSLTQVAALLHRHPSTLSKAIARHQRAQPQLFRLDVFHHLLPLG
jgi:hypothetical protein